MSAPSRRWLQRELQHKLLGPVLSIVFFGGLLSAYGAEYLVEKTFDRWLLDGARALSKQVEFVDGQARVTLSRQAESMLTYDYFDSVFFEVRQAGRHVVGDQGLPLQGEKERSYLAGARAYTGELGDRPVRVAWVPVSGPQGQAVDVMVAETLIKRQRAHNDLLWLFSPLALLALLVAWLVAGVLRRTLQPLERIAAGFGHQASVSLAAIPTDRVPRELMPFADALNGLLARVRAVLERERQFAATAAHQLRTPLTGLQLGLERAATAPDLAATRAVIEQLGGSTQRMARLVQQLLALSRLDPEVASDLEVAELDLDPLAQAVGESYLDAAAARGIALELQLPERGGVRVKGHAALLSEALGNLIDNALRYSPRGARVLISVQAQPPALVVADNGPGIAAAERERVFERFQRGSAGAADSYGSGLGLAIVREIATLHGASVTVDEAPGGGARFTVRFGGTPTPVAAAAPPGA